MIILILILEDDDNVHDVGVDNDDDDKVLTVLPSPHWRSTRLT